MVLKSPKSKLSNFFHKSPGQLCVALGFLFILGVTGVWGDGVQVSSEPSAVQIKELKKSQELELKALVQRQRIELRELEASHKARRRAWDQQEKQARHDYFSKSPKGDEKRVYIHSYLDRKKALDEMMKSEASQRKREQEIRKNAVIQEQKAAFDAYKSGTFLGPTALDTPKPQ